MFDSASDELGIPQVAIFDDDPYAAIGLSACVQKMLGVAGAVDGMCLYSADGGGRG